jgi:hypothetical protein
VDDDDFEGEEYTTFSPQRFSWVTLVRAGLDFAGHVAHGAACAIQIVEQAVVSHEIRCYEEKAFSDQLAYDLECLPETEEP